MSKVSKGGCEKVMRVGIVGAGAIGMLLAGYLEKEHEIIVFPHRIEQQENIKNEGIYVYDSRLGERSINVKVARLDKDFPSLDCCFICVKQSELQRILHTLHELPTDLPLIFIQNGMRHIDVLKILRQPVYIGIVSHGAKRLNDVCVSHKGKGNILLASFKKDHGELHKLADSLHQNEFPFEPVEDWRSIMREKMLVNSVINPLTALFQVPNKEVIKNEHILKLAKALCMEAATVLELDADAAWEKVVTIVKKTGDNTSSMLQDIQSGKETEIKAISGYLLYNTNESLPYTSFIYESIQALERKEKQI